MLVQVITLVGALLLGVTVFAFIYLAGMRAKWRLVQGPIIWLSRAFLNPRQMRTAGTPGAFASVIRTVGRTSGRLYETPVGVAFAGESLVIALPYGTRPNWLRNVLARGSATIVHEGRTYEVDRPEIIPTATVASSFSASDQRGFRLFAVDRCLRVRRVDLVQAA